ncbi:methyltransferase [Aquimarina sp. U1-2]|nr:methyltransferase [Aquimarina sp. U1-2]MBP2831744.1 methyltransferase [Aquimarina sp. U1-2]
MKIGTDGVLLGTWAPLQGTESTILDIGTGTGIIALIIAQRSNAETIDALEIDTDAFEQAVDNFETSPWGDRLFCYHASFQEFTEEIEGKYDFILSNPPFFSENYKTEHQKRNAARFQDSLPFEHLLYGVSKLMTNDGKFAVILPFREEQNFIALAKQYSLYAHKITRVKGNSSSKIKRSMIVFGFHQVAIATNELIIENSRHHYTQEYIDLTKDFYLNM